MRYAYEIWFTGREQPEALLLPDENLFHDFEAWTRGSDPGRRGFYLREPEGVRLVINFELVQMMRCYPYDQGADPDQ